MSEDMSKPRLKEGMQVYWVRSHGKNRGCVVSVVKVGRKIATLSNRITVDAETWRAKDSFDGVLYDSENAYIDHIERGRLFLKLRSSLTTLETPSLDTIKKAFELFGIEP